MQIINFTYISIGKNRELIYKSLVVMVIKSDLSFILKATEFLNIRMIKSASISHIIEK